MQFPKSPRSCNQYIWYNPITYTTPLILLMPSRTLHARSEDMISPIHTPGMIWPLDRHACDIVQPTRPLFPCLFVPLSLIFSPSSLLTLVSLRLVRIPLPAARLKVRHDATPKPDIPSPFHPQPHPHQSPFPPAHPSHAGIFPSFRRVSSHAGSSPRRASRGARGRWWRRRWRSVGCEAGKRCNSWVEVMWRVGGRWRGSGRRGRAWWVSWTTRGVDR